MTPETEPFIRRYEQGPALLRAAWDAVPPAARQRRPAPGKWSAHEVVHHCADSEQNAAARVRYLLAEKEPVLIGYDQDVWARELDYHALPAEPALAAVAAVRANTAPLLRRLTPEQLRKTGHHTEYGSYSVARWLEYMARHLEAHAAQIDRNVAAFSPR